jgi:hypothetical protein
MKLCSSGETASTSDTRCKRCAALNVLGLESGASQAQIKDAYYTLAKVWLRKAPGLGEERRAFADFDHNRAGRFELGVGPG